MGLGKLEGFMIGLVVVSIIMGVLGLFVSNMDKAYQTNITNSSGFENYNELGSMNNITRDLQNNITSISEPTGILDKIGGLFSSGYNSVLLITESFNVFETIFDNLLKATPFGEYTNVIKTGILVIVLIAIFIGGVLAIIVKSN